MMEPADPQLTDRTQITVHRMTLLKPPSDFVTSVGCFSLATEPIPSHTNGDLSFATAMQADSQEDGNRSSFRNVVFYSYLEFRAMDKVH
jgi:hypothetical protein